MEQDLGQNISSSTSEASGTQEGEGHTSLTPRRTRSNVWEHFEKELVHVDGEMKAVCRYCHLKLVTKSGTSSLRGHIANACPQIDTATRKTFQASMSKEAIANFVFDAELCREAMVKYIIHAEVPFLQMEDPYLQPWIDLMQPAFKVKHRHTIRNDCFKKFESLKKELHTVLQSLDSRVCLTSDIWTASQNLGYMVVTAHYIAADFKIQKKIIWFKVLEYPHSGYAIKEEIVRCLTEWGVRQKLFTLTLDNASNNILYVVFSMVLVIATILDPRRKADYVHFFFERALNDTSKAERYVVYALKWMERYFTLYEERCARTNNNEQQCARSRTSNVGSPVLGKRKIEVDFTQYASCRRFAQAPKAELDTYFEEPLEPNPDDDDFDVLGWWKGRSEKFPVLSTMVRDFLAIPLSTVPSESAFSLGGRLLGERRSSLAPEMLEALVCGKDWLFKTKDVAHVEDQEPQVAIQQ